MKKWIIIIIAVIIAYNLFAKEDLCEHCGYVGKVNCSACNGIGMTFPNGYFAQSKRCEECGGSCLVECSKCNGDGRLSLLEKIF